MTPSRQSYRAWAEEVACDYCGAAEGRRCTREGPDGTRLEMPRGHAFRRVGQDRAVRGRFPDELEVALDVLDGLIPAALAKSAGI